MNGKSYNVVYESVHGDLRASQPSATVDSGFVHACTCW